MGFSIDPSPTALLFGFTIQLQLQPVAPFKGSSNQLRYYFCQIWIVFQTKILDRVNLKPPP